LAKEEKLVLSYLKFLLAARCPKGFHNDLGANLNWQDEGGTGEWYGRAMEALAQTGLLAPWPHNLAAIFIFDQMSPLIPKALNLRTNAHLIIALSHRLSWRNLPSYEKWLSMRYQLAEVKGELFGQIIKNHQSAITKLADELISSYKQQSTKSWSWFEDVLTYDNGRLPLGLLYGYKITGRKKYFQVAVESLKFLLQKTYDSQKDCFSFPGYQGWYPKDGRKAAYGQQPVEAGSTVEVCVEAYNTTGEKQFLDFALNAYQWYTGRNILKLSLLNQESQGIKDGLEEWGVNPNEGAESILSYLLAYLSLRKVKK
jgi:hypothetical protein